MCRSFLFRVIILLNIIRYFFFFQSVDSALLRFFAKIYDFLLCLKFRNILCIFSRYLMNCLKSQEIGHVCMYSAGRSTKYSYNYNEEARLSSTQIIIHFSVTSSNIKKKLFDVISYYKIFCSFQYEYFLCEKTMVMKPSFNAYMYVNV